MKCVGPSQGENSKKHSSSFWLPRFDMKYGGKTAKRGNGVLVSHSMGYLKRTKISYVLRTFRLSPKLSFVVRYLFCMNIRSLWLNKGRYRLYRQCKWCLLCAFWSQYFVKDTLCMELSRGFSGKPMSKIWLWEDRWFDVFLHMSLSWMSG